MDLSGFGSRQADSKMCIKIFFEEKREITLPYSKSYYKVNYLRQYNAKVEIDE